MMRDRPLVAVNVAGARPNFMKVAPVHRAMLASGAFRPLFVHTGQHYDEEMSEVFLRDLGLPSPEVELGVGPGSHARQTAEVMIRLEPYLEDLRPDVVVVVGDVNSTLGAALAATKLHIPVAHIEAGLRSYDRSMPEEINRVLTDAVSDLLFAPSLDAVENLAKEGIAGDHVRFVGNVMIDSLERLLPEARTSDVVRRFGLVEGGFLVVTLHRPNNVDTDETLRAIVRTLIEAASIMPIVFPTHPRTRARLEAVGLASMLDGAGVRLIEPLGYVEFLGLMSQAAGVLTDSGGIQEETTILGVPCLTLRNRTERPITVTEGTNQVVGLDPDRTIAAVRAISDGAADRHPVRPELWDGHAAERIVADLERI